MSSFSLTSLFHHNDKTQLIQKQSTISKMSRRFSSMLTLKSKSNSTNTHRKVDTIFTPPTIVTSTSTNLSLISACDTEDDDILNTPTTLSVLDDKVMIEENTLALLEIPEPEPDQELEQVIEQKEVIEESEKVEVVELEQMIEEPEKDRSMLASMVRQTLHHAFDNIDEEIEKEWAQSRHVLLQELHARPRFKYY